jgi:hypothetical protein
MSCNRQLSPPACLSAGSNVPTGRLLTAARDRSQMPEQGNSGRLRHGFKRSLA